MNPEHHKTGLSSTHNLYAVKSFNKTYFLLGLIVLSPISSHITISLLSLPLALPELLLVPFIIYLLHNKRLIDINILKTKKFLISIYLFLILFFISLINDEFPIFQISSTARTYFYLILSTLIFVYNYKISDDEIVYVCFGSIIGWAIMSNVNFQDFNNNEIGSFATYGPLLAVSLFISLTLYYKKWLLLLSSVPFLLMIVLLSGIRRPLFIIVATLIIYIVFIAIKKNNNKIKLTIYLGLIGLISIPIVNQSRSYMQSQSGLHYYRIFERTEMMLMGERLKTDNTRLENFEELSFNKLDKYIIPKGFVSKDTKNNNSVGIFLDFPFLEVVYTIGIIPALILIIIFLYKYLKIFLRYIISMNSKNIVLLTNFTILFLLFFLDGTFISFDYAIPYTGFVLAKIIKQ